ncbi:hypothetical protein DYB36_006935 [Aphanomyces astaci]|uniref:Glycosyltransferase family 28 N-terminal domain-containing protein n=1 Tax=Aphanomyces astaci TaxID=112090 RepID=A0A397AGN8_APHAT|nr:hypothetical protein DYB36_006935 [Aphanomyces astaci]
MPPSTTTQQPPHTSSTPRRRIVIVVVGPRGDVQPYCILGQALTARDYDVTIATEARLKALVTAEFGLPFAPIAGDVYGGLFDIEFQHRFRVARSLKCLEMLTEWNDRFDIDDVLASYVSALAGADVVVCGGVLSIAQTYSIAEKHGLTWVPLFLGTCPLPTNEFPHWVLAGVPFGFLCSNHWSHSIVASKGWLQQRKHINKWRRHTLGLPPITSPLGIVDAMQTNDNITIYQASSLLLCVPQIPCPVIMDQFHHANNMVALGVAPAVVHKGSLYGSYVAKLVTQVLRNDRNIQTTAKDLGKFVNTESFDNTDRFCDWVVAAPPTFASPPSEQQSDGVVNRLGDSCLIAA